MLALIIFIATLALVVWRPGGLGIGWSALAGALAALATGVVQPGDLPAVWDIVWDATFTFVALIVISLILDEAGFFAWAALHVARWGAGSGARLFPLVLLLGALIAAFFANDGAALLLTPIVLAILVRLQLPPATALAFALASGFMADAASAPLVISNLVNIITANYFGVSFDRYAAVMVPVGVASVAATLVVTWLAFGRHVALRYDPGRLADPAGAIVDRAVFRAALPTLALLLAAYFLLGRWRLPFSLVTGAAAALLAAIAGRWWRGGRGAVLGLGAVMRAAPWQIVLFSVAMYLVVYGLGRAGLTAHGAALLTWLAQRGPFTATLGTGVLAALASSVMNNLPSTLISALAIEMADVPALTRELMVYASIIGNDLGPKFTPIGSLATLLWLHVLAGKGQRIGWGSYMRAGVVLTPPVLLAALCALALWLPLLRGA